MSGILQFLRLKIAPLSQGIRKNRHYLDSQSCGFVATNHTNLHEFAFVSIRVIRGFLDSVHLFFQIKFARFGVTQSAMKILCRFSLPPTWQRRDEFNAWKFEEIEKRDRS